MKVFHQPNPQSITKHAIKQKNTDQYPDYLNVSYLNLNFKLLFYLKHIKDLFPSEKRLALTLYILLKINRYKTSRSEIFFSNTWLTPQVMGCLSQMILPVQ